MNQVDVLVIGGGPGGTPAAMALASGGRRVLLVEKGTGLGGTCLFEGCIPSKILRESAYRLQAIRDAATFGLRLPAGDIAIDWRTIMQRKAIILHRRTQGALQHARQIPTLTVQFGTATLLGPRRARIVPPEGAPFDIAFSQAIVATGSVPNKIPVPGSDLPMVITSEQLLDIANLPQRLTVIGAGPIGVEMAQIFAAFGSTVTLLEAGPRILAPVDEELAIALEGHIRAQGIALECGVRIVGISHRDEGACIDYRDAGGVARAVPADYVLEAAGRSPNVADLGLEQTAVRVDHHGVKVGSTLETNEPGIYAVGDVLGHPMFAHWSTAQGLAVAGHLLDRPTRFPVPAHNSAVIFSMPEIGLAGLTEQEARTAGFDVAVARYSYRTDARAQVSGQGDGILKLVYDRTSRAVLGVHILVEGAASLLGEAALAVAAQARVETLAATIHPHPTLSEAIGSAAREAANSGR